MRPTPPSRRHEYAAVLAAVLAFGVRLLPWRHVFLPGGVVPFGVDDWYHLWRAERLAAAFPRIPDFDPYLSFPGGALVPWPFGFDLLLALPALLGAGTGAIPPWAALLVPALGALAVWATYRLGRAAFDPATGLAAAFLLALTPASCYATLVGHIDHHAAVAPLCLGIFLALLASLRATSPASQVRWGLCCGLLAGAAVATWVVTPPLYFLPVPAAILLSRGAVPLPHLRRTAISALVAAALVTAAVAAANTDLAANPFHLNQPSLFVLLPYVLIAAGVVASLYGRVALIGTLAAASLALISLGILPRYVAPLRDAASVAARTEVAAQMAAEGLPLLSSGGRFSLDYAVQAYGYLIVLAPVMVGVLLWRAARARFASAGETLVLLYAALGLLLLLFMSRFGEYAAPALALLFGWGVVAAARALRRHLAGPVHRVRAGIEAGALVAAAALALAPLASGTATLAVANPSWYAQNLAAFGREFARALPAHGDDGRTPALGLLAGWTDSHALLYLTRRPVMVSSLSTDALPQNRAGFRILLSGDEEEAWRALRANRIGWVVVSSAFAELEAMAAVAGLPQEFLALDRTPEGAPVYRPLPPFVRSLHTRLYLADGSAREVAGMPAAPLERFRLLVESAQGETIFRLPRPYFLGYEVVAGARLAGRAPPGTPVRLSLPVRTNTGRRFLYRQESVAGADGRFLFVVPYPTAGPGAPTRPLGPYLLETVEGPRRAEVSEEAVREGTTVPLG